MMLVLLQEGDSATGFVNGDWADEMYSAHEGTKSVLNALDVVEARLGRAEDQE